MDDLGMDRDRVAVMRRPWGALTAPGPDWTRVWRATPSAMRRQAIVRGIADDAVTSPRSQPRAG
jgi:hypothetical protein